MEDFNVLARNAFKTVSSVIYFRVIELILGGCFQNVHAYCNVIQRRVGVVITDELFTNVILFAALSLSWFVLQFVSSVNKGLKFLQVTSLSAGQFMIEVVEATPTTPSSKCVTRRPSFDQAEEPLLHHLPSNESTAAMCSVTTTTRPRSKSKPTQIFIHPSQSNFARADAFALQRGLGGSTEYVSNVGHPGSAESWREGKGQEAARELLGHRRSTSSSQFQIGDDGDD